MPPTPTTDDRSPQQILDRMHRPRWCVATEAGRLYWDLVGAALRDDAATIRRHLAADPQCARLAYWYTPPLHFAVRQGCLEATRALWEAYPFDEVTKLIGLADDRGHTAVAGYLRDAVGGATADSDLRLHEAVEAGDFDELRRLLGSDPGLAERRDPAGRTALHLAVIAGDGATVDALIAAGAPLDATDHQGFRAVHYACWRSLYWQPVEGAALRTRLLAAGAADSPTLAAQRGDLETLRAVVEADAAAVDDGDTLGKRPLSAAVQGGHAEIVRYLLDHGADPRRPEGRCCPHGSALMEAVVADRLEMTGWLLEAGADPNGYIDSSGTPAMRATSDRLRGLLYGYGGLPENAWSLAQRGELAGLAVVLRYCADPFSDEDQEFLTTPYTAIVSGCRRRAETGQSTDAHEAMLALFLRRQHPMPKVLTACKTYLYHVPHMTRQLLAHGLDPNLPDWLGRTPLHDLCAGNRHVPDPAPLVTMFLEHGADVDAIDEEDRSTPLGIAAREGDVALVELLLKAGASPRACGAPWAAPLAWAQRRGHDAVARLLCGAGAA